MADAAAAPRLPASGLRGWWRSPAMRRFRRHPGSWVGGTIVVVLVLVALFAPYLADRPPNAQNLRVRLQPPSLEHPFGTDEFGRSVYSRVLHGTRVSLLTGLVPVLVALTIGSTIGLVAGYVRGRLDGVLMRIMDVLLAFPSLLLALAVVGTLGPGIVNAVIAIAIVDIPQYARLVRSVVLGAREEDYVHAARALGAGDARLMWLHVAPTAIGPVVVQSTLGIGFAILAIAGLSFLGLGVQPPVSDWGEMLARGRRFLPDASWLMIFPGLAVSVTVLGFNLLGDALRDALDPRG
jgi:peptide/nickel transport system permease protein